jgi:hypothetical protein
MASKTPLKDKLDILIKLGTLCGMVYYTTNLLFDKGIFQYKDGMFSLVPLLSYRFHCRIAIIIIVMAVLLFFAWLAHNFLSGKQAYDTYTAMVIMIVFLFLMCGVGITYALTGPVPIYGLVLLLLVPIPLFIYFGVVIIRIIKSAITGD